MKYALVNPNWTFEGSTYFGCKEPHFPLELLYAREVLWATGHEVLLVDAMMEDLKPADVRERLSTFCEDFFSDPHSSVISLLALSATRTSCSKALDDRA